MTQNPDNPSIKSWFNFTEADHAEAVALITQLWDKRGSSWHQGYNEGRNHGSEALEAIIEQQHALLQQIRDQLHLCRPEHVIRPLIAAIDKALEQTK